LTDFSLRRIALPAFGPTLCFGIGEGAILPIVPLLARDLGAPVPTAALLLTLIGIGSLLNNIPASLITARWGERWSLVAAGLWSALGMALCLFASHASIASPITLLAAGCFMVGMSQGVYNLARQSYLTEAVPITHRARALSTLGGVMRIGQFVGPLLAAGIVHWLGLEAAFGVGIVAVSCAALIGSRVPDLRHADERSTQGPATVTWSSTVVAHRQVFLTAGIAVLLVGAVRASRQAVIPLWADHLGLAPAMASVIYGLSGGIEMLLFYPAGKLMDAKGRRWVTLPSMLSMAAGLLLMPFTDGFITMLLAALLIGFGNGMGAGMNMTLGADHAPRQGRAYFLGVWRLMADIGASGGPALLSLLAASLSLASGIAATGMIAVGAAAILYRLKPAGQHDGS
jgi:MFS family permease